MSDILQNVERDKRQKWNEKFEDYTSENWNRDNFERKLRRLKQDIDSIEDNITDLQERRREITGVPEGSSPDDMSTNDFGEIEGSVFDDEIKDFGEKDFKALLKKNLGGVNPTLKVLDDKRDELQSIRKKEAEWKTLQFELSAIATSKLESISKTFKTQFKSSEVAEDFEKHAQQIVESQVAQAKSEVKQDLMKEVAELEQATNSARNEVKNAWKYLDRFGEIFAEYLEKEKIGEIDGEEERLKKIASEALEEGLETLATEKGTVDFSGEKLAAEQKKNERKEARDSATGKLDLAKYNLKDKDLDDQHEVLQRMSENEELLEMTLSDIVDLTDLTEEELAGDGGVLDGIEDEYSTRFGID